MDITTSSIKIYTFTLSEIELENYLEEPEELIRNLRRARLNGLTPPEKNQTSEGARIKRRITDMPKRHNKTSGDGQRETQKRRSTAKYPEKLGATITCPKCGMLVKTRGLLIHQRGSKCEARAALSTSID